MSNYEGRDRIPAMDPQAIKEQRDEDAWGEAFEHLKMLHEQRKSMISGLEAIDKDISGAAKHEMATWVTISEKRKVFMDQPVRTRHE